MQRRGKANKLRKTKFADIFELLDPAKPLGNLRLNVLVMWAHKFGVLCLMLAYVLFLWFVSKRVLTNLGIFTKGVVIHIVGMSAMAQIKALQVRTEKDQGSTISRNVKIKN